MTRRDQRGRDLPLIAWGEELRRRKLERRQRLRRWTALVVPVISAVMLSIVLPARPRLIWNASASAPIGLYAVEPGGEPRRGDMVIALVPSSVRSLADSRRYLPANVPLVKHVGAVAGDTVCALKSAISVNGVTVAIRREKDGLGRRLPWWNGCRRLRRGQVFLLSAGVPGSFDGRYFGVSSSADIIGTARPLWVR